MTMLEQEARELLERAMKLPRELRHGIAHEMLSDGAADLETDAERAALKAELTRRWDRLRSGEDVGTPAEEVIEKLFRRAEEYKKSS